ncbi:MULTISPECIES: OmpP1/FadL family transporter [Pseudomonas]|uniref:Aromatic hydrocarbon degradation protein n=1 Tax=Pseudomonas cichorii TaxID=36746 RepID=A0A3M4WGF9_PSECI|nr:MULTISPECIES: outer membrane protein transport protein [Pseudomonas]AHF68935.1 aromatic hydrocarbon degradation protein [Pseudomonas cichorii JBC1]QVE15916.1 outer membrane protein transport protein [Pseudomonas cichorii]RMR62973.1 Aromatic hydrocarbon degradation protein [Pseudomonas cichorii]SDN25532.1 long-chain fatty acid transport protein [Pseudomonas cichorii]GFM91040.1 aromatic hydrocarbon degradation protein [Pseudomonas cichorii]
MKITTKAIHRTTLGLAIGLASSQLLASGFAINEQSISAMGTGFAGRSSSAEDASTVFGNPAGMSRLKREQVSVGAAAIIAKTDISNASSTFGGSNDGDMVPVVGVPMGYYVKPLDDQWAVGLGVYVPFGLVTDYENGFAGRYWADKSHVQVITFQPTVSYAFNDRVSIGFGPTINRIEGELTSSTINAASFGTNDGKVKIKGDDVALGFNVGILVQATDTTRLGLTYHSKVDYKLEGKTKVEGASFGPFNGQKYDASLDISTPESVDFSITQQLDENWTVYAGSTWTRWSRLKDITVNNSGVPAGLGGANGAIGRISEEQDWHDTWAHAIGASYKVNNEWTLRTGYSVDQSPTNNVNRSPRIPTGDRQIVSFGAGWTPSDAITIDVAYSYLWEDEAKIRNASTSKGAYSADFKNSAHGIGTSLTYRF